MNKINGIVKKIVFEVYKDKIESLSFDESSGYVNFYWGIYSQKIGQELISNKIPFQSLYDAGYGHDFDKSDPKWSKRYTEVCKKTPNHEFMQTVLEQVFQKEILLKTLNLFDFSSCLSDYSKSNSILHILRDYKEVGINKILINKEVTDEIMKHSSKISIHPNIFISFIHSGFFFEENDLIKTIKPSYKRTFNNSNNDNFEEIYSHNAKNKIQYEYLAMSSLLEEQNIIKQKKLKI